MKIIVQAVRERKAFVDEILTQLPMAIVHYDTKRNARETMLECFRISDDDTIHLEDDIILTSNFLDKALAVISNHPNELIQFFSMRAKDITIGSRAENGSNYIMNQCFYMPKDMHQEIIDFVPIANGLGYDVEGTDTLIQAYLKYNKINYWLSVPSLVQHRQVKSAINPRRSSKRQSGTFV